MPNSHSTLTSLFSDIADAIRGKTGSSATIVADNFPTAIANIPTGGSANIQSLSVTTNGTYTASGNVDGYSPVTVNVSGGGGGSASDAVRFFDYDGTILHSYSAEDFAALTAMPANPTHTGLTSQGWNWSLADAKAQMVAQPNDTLMIGQMYVTDDGKTRVYISLDDSARLSPYLGICPNGTVVVDWGDNTATDTLTGTSLTTVQRVQHTYASTGDYVITLTVSSGNFQIYGASTNGSYLLTRTNANASSQRCYQNAIQKVELGANVSIGNYAFGYCYSLSSITIPSSVTNIGEYTFLTCYSLTSITIPSNVTNIGKYAFSACYSLTSITIPNGITNILEAVFNNCSSLSDITLPNSLTSIGVNAFYHCDSLARITLPSGLTSINNYAFSSCGSLTSITIPNGVTSIPSYAFQYCYSLSDITLPNRLNSIGMYAFDYCYALTNITIPYGIASINTYTFRYCFSLASVTIPSSVTNIDTNAFYECHSLSSVTLQSGLTSIGASAFQYCYSLSSITIPSSVTIIGNHAFAYCRSLESVTIPSGVTSINNYMLSDCDSLASITIPSSVTSIGAYAFRSNYGVAEYHVLPTTPPTLANTNAFTGILTDCKIYVPAASLTAYQEATNWSTYASYMVGE